MQQRRVPWQLVALASLSLAAVAHQSDLGSRLEYGLADVGAGFLQHQIESDVVIVGIDAKSIAELRGWPWPRRHHAALIEKLAEAPPQQLFIDIDFSTTSTAQDDALLASALAAWDGPAIILPAFMQYASSASSELLLAEPIEILRQHAAVASVNMELGSDGLVRKVRRAWTFEGRSLPAAAAFLNDSAAQFDAESATDLTIDFTIHPSSFEYLSYSDIIGNRTPAEYYADKTVFVGATAIELGDMLPVPVYKSLPGVVVQALAYESQRVGNLQPVAATPYWIAVFLLSVILSYGFCRQSWQRNILAVAVCLATIAAAALYLYATFDLIIKVVPLSVATVAAYLLATLRSLEAETMRALMYAVGYRKRNALLRSIVLSSTDCIVCIDAEGRIQTVNPAATSLFSCDMSQLVGTSIFAFIPELRAGESDDQQQNFEQMSESLLECTASTAMRGDFPVELSISRVLLKDEILYTAIVRDISERKAQQRQLQFQATHDPLTTLPNRPALAAHLDARLAGRGSDTCVALFMIDLDRFKEVNDTLGHNVGDHVLHEVARRLADVARDRGFLARIGGDEFALVVERFHDRAMISRLSQDLADCLKTPIETSGIAIEVGLSIGIARSPDDARDAETLFKYADVAMYSAKRAGADFEYYDAANDRHTVRKLTILSRLRRAIAAGELELYFQPQVNLATGRVDGVEALLRWHDQTLGDVSPDEFIPLAEATDLIQPLSNWTVQRALEQSVAWREDGLDLRVAINISARVLQDVSFPTRISELVDSAGVSADRIELEITESAIMIDPQRALQVTQRLSDMGFMVSVDDYGTGYSSLAYLRDLPVHALKLDKSFVLTMQERSENRVIVESTVQMAHALNLKVVAEGVETSTAAQILSDFGYDFAQGYLYSAALPATALADWVRDFESASDPGQLQKVRNTGT